MYPFNRKWSIKVLCVSKIYEIADWRLRLAPTTSLLLWQVAPDWSIPAILYLYKARSSLLYFDQ